MKIGLDIDADVLKSFLKRYPQAMAESTSIFIDRVGYKLQNASVKAAPAITGNLRRSIFYFGREAASYMSGNLEGQLRVNAKYGAVVHGAPYRENALKKNGMRRKETPFITRGIKNSRDFINDETKAIFNRVLE